MCMYEMEIVCVLALVSSSGKQFREALELGLVNSLEASIKHR